MSERVEGLRILVCHSRYLSGSASGENRVVDDEISLLRRAGHYVATYMPAVDIRRTTDLVRTAIDAVWNHRAQRDIATLVARHRPDIVHFHNLFPALSPASLRLRSNTRPAQVMTLHNYRWMCLPGTFLRSDGICEDCLGKVPWRGIAFRCYQESALGSAAIASSITMHRAVSSLDRVDLFLAISEFVKRKHVEAGFAMARILVKPHFAWPSRRRHGPGSYMLYLGRLSREKGVHVLLTAWRDRGGRLLIAGSGPEDERLRAVAGNGVKFLGQVSAERAEQLIRGARCVVVPSICYEGASRVVIEACAAGVPSIASDIGGLKEAVAHDVTGLLVPPSDAASLRLAIERMQDGRETERMGAAAYDLWDQHFRPEVALPQIEGSYLKAIDSLRSRTVAP
jgi:glycosyltransferase involved in cell wall biosynthesis